MYNKTKIFKRKNVFIMNIIFYFLILFTGRNASDDDSLKKQLENAHEIFLELNSKTTNASKRLSLLNNLVKLIDLPLAEGLTTFSTDEILLW